MPEPCWLDACFYACDNTSTSSPWIWHRKEQWTAARALTLPHSFPYAVRGICFTCTAGNRCPNRGAAIHAYSLQPRCWPYLEPSIQPCTACLPNRCPRPLPPPPPHQTLSSAPSWAAASPALGTHSPRPPAGSSPAAGGPASLLLACAPPPLLDCAHGCAAPAQSSARGSAGGRNWIRALVSWQ